MGYTPHDKTLRGWRAWFSGNRRYDSRTPLELLPRKGLLLVRAYFPDLPTGQHCTQIYAGSDYYILRPGVGWEDEYETYTAITQYLAEHPDAIVFEGEEVPEAEWEAAREVCVESVSWV